MSIVTYKLGGLIRSATGSLDLNGVPLFVWADPVMAPDMFMMDVGPWLLPGPNVIDVTVAPISTRVDLQVGIDAWSGSTLQQRTVLAWPEPAEPVSVGVPRHLRRSVHIDHPPPTRMWRDVQPLGADEATRVEAVGFVGHVVRTLQLGSVPDVVALRSYRDAELGACKGWSPAKIRATTDKEARCLGDRKTWTVKPLALTKLRITAVGNGHILRIRPAGGDHAIVYRDTDGFEIRQDLYIGKVRGQWTWLR